MPLARMHPGGSVPTTGCHAAQTLQSSTSQRLGAFGTLLGDKAADLTSLASSGLGDLLQPNAASSLLSSFRSRFQ